MQEIRLSNIIARPHLKHFNSDKLHQALHGGRAGYKSSRNALKIALRTLEDPNCEVIVVRQDYSDHKDTTFNDLKWAYDMLGVKLKQGIHYPEGNDLWIRLPNGVRIHFKHMKDVDKLKGTRASNPKNTIRIVWFYEITQMKSAWHIENAISGFVRGVRDWFWVLYEWNDAPKPSHWTYSWVKLMDKNPDAIVQKVNYNDTPLQQQLDFLGEIMLKQIDNLKEIDPEQYKNIYLGFPANLDGTVYKLFDADKIVGGLQYDYVDMSIGVDFGSNDATVFTARGTLKKYKGIEIPMTWYHKNGKSRHIMSINDYVDAFLMFAKEVYMKYEIPLSVYIDPANLSFKQLIEEKSMSNEYAYIMVERLKKTKRNKKSKDAVQERVDFTEIMLGASYVKIDESCEELIKAFYEAEYNKKGDRADDGTSDIDSLDSFEYSWLMDMNFMRETILR